ncbi:hypothetical protein [Cytobacillus sp. FSL H8-0458]
MRSALDNVKKAAKYVPHTHEEDGILKRFNNV